MDSSYGPLLPGTSLLFLIRSLYKLVQKSSRVPGNSVLLGSTIILGCTEAMLMFNVFAASRWGQRCC